ncbi:McrC family protein [uncultured Desulfovibrio sp.]|uniref:McrC family protein n=1 Tax=uncultured Desulfovibrio sp. TaxID=167968 RepID=UPI00265CF5F2|nr:McrC family protein [uncultured Desulfovibrio sp.]
MTRLTIREYGFLTTAPVSVPTLNKAQVTSSAFDWLCRFCEREKNAASLRDRQTLQWKSFVGVLRTSCGLELEILPKTQHEAASVEECRAQLVRMLSKVLDVTCCETAEADIDMFRMPLTEWVARQFLLHLHALLKRGLRFDYRRVEEEQTYLRGQLDVRRQVQQLPHRQHLFRIRHDVFSEDMPENRLLRSALEVVTASVREAGNWRLAASLRHVVATVPRSQDIQADFTRWRQDRLMADYARVRPWCELVLGKYMPWAVSGQQCGISLLFSMHELFERYVARSLRDRLMPGASLDAQCAGKPFCTQKGGKIFRLRPDMVVRYGEKAWVLDTKWKRLGRDGEEDSISIQDIYQLYAYGCQWLDGQGDVILVYPEHDRFPHPQPPFVFQRPQQVPEAPPLRLLVSTFDLSTDCLSCHGTAGDWFPWLRRA